VSDAAATVLADAAAAGIHVFPITTPFAIGTVNAILIEGDPLTLVDCGPNSATSLAALEDALVSVGYRVEDIELLVITHQHMDHLGLARVVAERAVAPVACLAAVAPYLEGWNEWASRDDDFAARLMALHGLEPHVSTTLRSMARLMRGWGAPSRVDVLLEDGDSIACGSRAFRVLHRPGHSPSDIVLHDEQSGVLIAGDHLLLKISSNALLSHPLTVEDWTGPRPQPLLEYRRSLRATREIDASLVLGGHGGPVTDHRALIDDRLRSHEQRADRLLALLEHAPQTGHQLAASMWQDAALTQAFLTLSEVLGHLDLLLEAGRIVERRADERVWYEAV
jgi:glyoxylase-like metal-dependent hydrolase (beta-lactamase superfamily II)